MRHHPNIKAFFILFVLLAGCWDAPHSHVLDPLGENYTPAGQFSGQVTALNGNTGLANTTIQLENTNYQTVTNTNGQFAFESLPEGSYTVNILRAGYVEKSDNISIIDQDFVERFYALNARPQIQSVQVTSEHLSRWFPAPNERFQLWVTLSVHDLDGQSDILSANLQIGAPYNFTIPLDYNSQANQYFKVLTEEQLPANINALIGVPMTFTVNDQTTGSGTDSNQLVRVITETPVALSPEGLISLPAFPKPTLTWDAGNFDFPFTWQINVFRVENNIKILVEEQSLTNDNLSYQLLSTLPAGAYYWTVSVEDAFGNISRSREAGFQIE